MKEFYITWLLLPVFCSAFSQAIAIQEVLYNQSAGNDKFELINTTSTTIDISEWWICARFGYHQLSNASQIEVLEGNLEMPPGSTIKMRLISFNLHNTHSDFGIYVDGNFGSATSMMDFIQWGDDTDVGRGYVAVTKGIWRDLNPPNLQLDFIPAATGDFSTNWDGTNEGGGELTYSTDFMNAESTLPIKLLTLSGRVNMNMQAELNWIALDEINSEKHFIEKSLDGIIYSVIGEVAAQNLGPVPAEYFFLDESPVINAINYYRIRQVDYDGGELISTPLILKVKSVDNHSIFISPNPISGHGCFSMEFYWQKEVPLAQFRIADMTGKIVDSFVEPVYEGYNNVIHQFYGLEPGQYLMFLSDNEGEYCVQYFLIGK